MIYAKLDVTLAGHLKAHRAGRAMATWAWALAYIREQELDGFLPSEALRLAWVGEQQAKADCDVLVSVGLFAPSEGGWEMLKYGEKNETKRTISQRKKEVRERVQKHRVTRYTSEPVTRITTTVVPGSGSGSGSESRSEEPEQIGIASPPDWWSGTLGAVEMAMGVSLPPAEAWARYAGHRASKEPPKPTSHADAVHWLGTVMVREHREARDEAARRNARDGERTAAFVQQRSGPEVKPQDSRKQFRERDEWERTAGPPDPATAERMRKLLGKVGT